MRRSLVRMDRRLTFEMSSVVRKVEASRMNRTMEPKFAQSIPHMSHGTTTGGGIGVGHASSQSFFFKDF